VVTSYILLPIVILLVIVESVSMPPMFFHYISGPFELVFPKSLLCNDICLRQVYLDLFILQKCYSFMFSISMSIYTWLLFHVDYVGSCCH
jgi:hypothetical protein